MRGTAVQEAPPNLLLCPLKIMRDPKKASWRIKKKRLNHSEKSELPVGRHVVCHAIPCCHFAGTNEQRKHTMPPSMKRLSLASREKSPAPPIDRQIQDKMPAPPPLPPRRQRQLERPGSASLWEAARSGPPAACGAADGQVCSAHSEEHRSDFVRCLCDV